MSSSLLSSLLLLLLFIVWHEANTTTTTTNTYNHNKPDNSTHCYRVWCVRHDEYVAFSVWALHGWWPWHLTSWPKWRDMKSVYQFWTSCYILFFSYGNCNCNWGTCIASPTRRPRAHHRVNPYLCRQNETKMFQITTKQVRRSQQFQLRR